jgi:hypothetical protein
VPLTNAPSASARSSVPGATCSGRSTTQRLPSSGHFPPKRALGRADRAQRVAHLPVMVLTGAMLGADRDAAQRELSC